MTDKSLPPLSEEEIETIISELHHLVWRDPKKRSWDELAADANLSPSTINKLARSETRRPQWLTIVKLLRAFNYRVAFVHISQGRIEGELKLRRRKK